MQPLFTTNAIVKRMFSSHLFAIFAKTQAICIFTESARIPNKSKMTKKPLFKSKEPRN